MLLCPTTSWTFLLFTNAVLRINRFTQGCWVSTIDYRGVECLCHQKSLYHGHYASFV